MRRLLLCSGVYGEKNSIDCLRRLAAKRRPEGILFAGGILSRNRETAPRSTSRWDLTTADERLFVYGLFATLEELAEFSAVVPGLNFEPGDDFFRLAMTAETAFPHLHIAHATLVEAGDLAVCGLGMAIASQALMREDSYSPVKAFYCLRSLRTSQKPRKVLLLADSPLGPLGGPEGKGVIGEIIAGLRPTLCVVAGRTERRGLQRIADTLVVNPGSLADGSAAWLDWDRNGDDQIEFVSGLQPVGGESKALKLAEANRAVEAALAEAGKLSVEISVSVCDANGHLVTHQRMAGVFAEAPRLSIGKAIVAAELGCPSGEPTGKTPDHLLPGRVHAAGAPFVPRRGGLPVIREGESVGGIGVCGAPTEGQDEDCARAGIEALSSDGYTYGNTGFSEDQPCQ